jgi:hypothetical protein
MSLSFFKKKNHYSQAVFLLKNPVVAMIQSENDGEL